MKKTLFSLFFLFSIYLHADTPANKLVVLAYRNTACSVIINVDEVCCSINFENAEHLVGTGSNTYSLGNLSMYLFNNQTAIPHELELICSTYDATNNVYVAYNGAAPLVIGVQLDFNTTGERVDYYFIDPTTNPVLLRSSNATISCESHTLYFYILQSSENIFINGTYTASFELYFNTT